jgi:hypothetical protein
MHYPFPISKASLSAVSETVPCRFNDVSPSECHNVMRCQVGSMHTWPTLLACISWLVELLRYDEEVQTNPDPQVRPGCMP